MSEIDLDEDERPFSDDALRAYRLPAAVVPIALFMASMWGVYDGMHDPDGDRAWGSLAVFTPSIMAIWWAAAAACWRSPTGPAVLIRMVTAPLIVHVPLIVANVLGKLALWSLPGNRDVIAHAGGRRQHHYWSEGIGGELLLTGLGGYAMAGAIGILAILVITLPVLSIRAPEALALGSHLEKIEHPSLRDNTTAQVFVGLGLLCAGLLASLLFTYTTLGTTLIALGIILMLLACILTIAARIRARRDLTHRSNPRRQPK